MPVWIVYYTDGRTIQDDQCCPESLPKRDVQAIVQQHDSAGWHCLSGNDFYVWRDDRWWGVDQFGMYDYLIGPGWKVVLFGRFISDADYAAILARATKHMNLLRKSTARGERGR